MVVTNAHVVAGEHDTIVEIGGHSPDLPAHAIAFDPTNDIAVLEVPGLSRAALPLAAAARPLALAASPPSGVPAAILGYPENGPFDARAGRIGRTQTVLTQDAYGRGPVSRLLTPLRGLVRPGNSGGPMVDAGGQVLTTVFAGTVGGSAHGGYGVANSDVAGVLRRPDANAGAHRGAQVSPPGGRHLGDVCRAARPGHHPLR